ncbi:3-phosphoshikimate 1-carboxyvinyltransferase [Desulfobacterales bacterium HSG17]|nr:3-phosphoshikimate 1-carboxyvinyltransferase [Desulfobacterales bacterium HSG17]
MIEIKPLENIDASVSIPGSKSFTHRILIASALSDGICSIANMLKSEDTLLTLSTLRQMGVNAEEENEKLIIHGTNGILKSPEKEIHLGNSGTSMRLMAAVAALGNGPAILTGTERMQERPIGELLDGLKQMGISAKSINNNGCPPIEITGKKIKGGAVNLKCGISSQYLSALLLIAPYCQDNLEINVIQGPVSKPYIDMTIDIMNKFGIDVKRQGYEKFHVQGKQVYKSGAYTVEPDASNAGYFWAAAAITGGTVKVKDISLDSCQGDLALLKCFENMGCKVERKKDGIILSGAPLTAIDVDMADIPDMVPTLGVVAAFAKGTTIIRNVAHLRAKECDRLSAVATELTKMGIDARCTDDELFIKGGNPKGAEIETYDDHRIAMCFAVAGLKVPGVFIKGEQCVNKSFPNFWEVFKQLY